MQIDNIEEMKEWMLKAYPNEGCGIIVNSLFIGCENIHETPQTDFKISKVDYAQYLLNGSLQGVVHSHTQHKGPALDGKGRGYDARTPSMLDLQSQESLDLPSGIVSCEGENVSTILWFGLNEPAPILGRNFVHNVYDCYTLARDYYWMNYKIKLGVYPRPMLWSLEDEDIFEKNFTENGFRILGKEEEPEIGDGILFKIRSGKVNHCGVYTGNSRFVHHLWGRLSEEDGTLKWQKQIYAFIRHHQREPHPC